MQGFHQVATMEHNVINETTNVTKLWQTEENTTIVKPRIVKPRSTMYERNTSKTFDYLASH